MDNTPSRDALQEEIARLRKEVAELRAACRECQALFDASMDAILMTLPDGSILKANPAACEMFQMTEQELINGGRAALFGGNEKYLAQILADRAATGRFRGELVHRRRDGTRFYGDVTSILYTDRENRARTCTIIRDITARKQAEADLLAYKEIVSATGDFISLVDCNYRYRIINDAYLMINQKPRDAIIGHTVAENIGEEVFQSVVKARLDRCLNGKPVRYQEWFTYARNGRRCIDITYTPYRKDGAIVGVVVNGRDITDIKRAEEALAESRRKLQQARKMEAVGTLSGGIAHEFNNILSVVLGNAELAMEDLPAYHPIREFLTEIRNASLRGKEVVQDLLSFSRPTARRFEPVRVSAVVKEAVTFLQPGAPAHVRIVCHADETHDLTKGDPAQIHQVVVNLVRNALQATTAGGGGVVIAVEAVRLPEETICFNATLAPGKYVCLRVTDEGEGIRPENIEKIFDPFFTTREVHQGAGMGLSVVHGILLAHGGGIRIRSQAEAGTVAECWFPAIDPPETVSRQPEPAPSPRPAHILYIDDEDAIVKMGRIRLERLGYQVTTFTEPDAAIHWLERHAGEIDLVITDLTMPGMTGEQVIRRIKEIDPALPAIICSGYSDRIDADKARRMGATGLLGKPYAKAELAAAVGTVLDRLGEDGDA